ncbi:putative sulfate exporter family transporter [Candidatus Acetothermia bacterium]|jgi:uncharacterized integral membrane protein (TIGR00698 family)|nr:putative sulfate exporter family transporter [Candidatus Acetothermia bacterium]MCI2431759.1 putative sulfate exporter family transporter [Candidatus Acetothermia bacterium]MCI2436757.1 putative sulfate exporter family transporter [Candidatus Acetothermia bacterium]
MSAQRLARGVFGVEAPREIVKLVPGVALAAAIMLLALPVADLMGAWILSLQGIDPTGKASPLSAVLVAILLGILVANLVKLPQTFNAGIQFSVTKLLRLGIIFVGIKLSLLDVLKLGAWGIPIVAVAIFSGLLFVSWFNRLLKLPDRLGTLIAAGTGICGVTAIVSTAPAIKAEEREVAYAVANITLFGLLGMFLYPYVAPLLLQTSEQIGLFLGTAVHETSQVVGAALTYKEVFGDDVALKAATVTKLTRNLFLAVVVPLLTFLYLRRQGGTSASAVSVRGLLPVFVLGFIAMAVVRSLGDLTLQSNSVWQALTAQIGDLWGSKYLLGTAMAAVGLGTSFSVFKGVGFKPFVVGLVGALLVGIVGLIMALLLGAYVRL